MSSFGRRIFSPDINFPPYKVGIHACVFGAGIDANGVDRTGLVFMGKEIKGGNWTLVQGGLKPLIEDFEEETPEQAALRELVEEVGTEEVQLIAAQNCSSVSNFRRIGGYSGKIEILFLYVLQPSARININADPNPAFSDYQWCELGDIPRIGYQHRDQYTWIARSFSDLPLALKSLPADCTDRECLVALRKAMMFTPAETLQQFSSRPPERFPMPPADSPLFRPRHMNSRRQAGVALG